MRGLVSGWWVLEGFKLLIDIYVCMHCTAPSSRVSLRRPLHRSDCTIYNWSTAYTAQDLLDLIQLLVSRKVNPMFIRTTRIYLTTNLAFFLGGGGVLGSKSPCFHHYKNTPRLPSNRNVCIVLLLR